MQDFNAAYGRSGTRWEGCYRATVADRERFLLTAMREIEINPVRAGLITGPGESPGSSDGRNGRGKSRPNADWLTPHPGYLKLGRSDPERQRFDWSLFRIASTSAGLADIRECTHKGWALGTKRFTEELETLGQRCGAPNGAGRRAKHSKHL